MHTCTEYRLETRPPASTVAKAGDLLAGTETVWSLSYDNGPGQEKTELKPGSKSLQQVTKATSYHATLGNIDVSLRESEERHQESLMNTYVPHLRGFKRQTRFAILSASDPIGAGEANRGSTPTPTQRPFQDSNHVFAHGGLISSPGCLAGKRSQQPSCRVTSICLFQLPTAPFPLSVFFSTVLNLRSSQFPPPALHSPWSKWSTPPSRQPKLACPPPAR